MTNMRRVTICFPDDLNEKILDLRKTDEYVRCTFGEIVRRLVIKGIEIEEAKKGQKS